MLLRPFRPIEHDARQPQVIPAECFHLGTSLCCNHLNFLGATSLGGFRPQQPSSVTPLTKQPIQTVKRLRGEHNVFAPVADRPSREGERDLGEDLAVAQPLLPQGLDSLAPLPPFERIAGVIRDEPTEWGANPIQRLNPT